VALTCAVCGAGEVRRKLEKSGVEILQCAVCALAFWRPSPDFDAKHLYDADYFASQHASHGYDDYGALEPALRRTFARRLGALPQRAGARLLDVGAAYGFAAAEASRAGFRVTGLELAVEAGRQAATRVPGRIVRASALALPFADASFDVITLWDVIEHLPDPQRAAAEIARCLRPGGRVALTTGDVESWAARLSGARWHLYTLPEHLFFFSRESLRRLLGAHGLRVTRMRASGALYPVGYLLERLRKTLFGGGSRIESSSRLARLVVPMNLFDVLEVEAVRVDAAAASVTARAASSRA
jgi:2-polyprenyl-3-methyl-5-hydroxy-6-metoxy-1,4-benzoquinol methylase